MIMGGLLRTGIGSVVILVITTGAIVPVLSDSGVNAPEGIAPVRVMPEGNAPVRVMPEGNAQDRVMPEGNAQDRVMPEGTTSGTALQAPDSLHRVIDFVDLPSELAGGADLQWHFQFRESWIIDPRKSMLVKMVDEISIVDRKNPENPQDSLKAVLQILLGGKPVVQGRVRLHEISYEYCLLDPHMPDASNAEFTGTGISDPYTERLQDELIELVTGNSSQLETYRLKEQLLSFLFHETWLIHPVSLRISKRVNGITPVIWQQRRTVNGESVNDAATGLPVYYKNQLPRIQLRNP